MATRNEKILIAALIATIIIAGVVVFIVYRIRSRGTVRAVGVKVTWDLAGTDNVTDIDWGSVYPGSKYGITVYISNTGNTNITLTMYAENWSPSYANQTISYTWDYTGQVLYSGNVIPVQLQVSIATITNVTDFSNDIVIGAIEYLGST